MSSMGRSGAGVRPRRRPVAVLALVVVLCVAVGGVAPATGSPAGSAPDEREFEAVQSVVDHDTLQHFVMSSSTGRLAVLFYDVDAWYAASRPPGPDQPWSEPQRVDARRTGYAKPLVRWPDGRLTIAVDDGHDGVVLVTMATDGTFGETVRVPDGYPLIAGEQGVGVGLADGSIVLIGRSFSGPDVAQPDLVQAATLATDGSWSLSEGRPAPRYTSVGGAWTGDGPGIRVVVVRRAVGDAPADIRSVVLKQDGSWGASQPVPVETRGHFRSGQVSFHTDGQGAASLMWTEQRGRGPRAVVSVRPAGGSWSPTRARRGNEATNRFAAMGPDGSTTVGTTIRAGGRGRGRVVISTLSPQGEWVQRRTAYVGTFVPIFPKVLWGMDRDGVLLMEVPAAPRTLYLECPPVGECEQVASSAPQSGDRFARFSTGADGAGYQMRWSSSCSPVGLCSRRLPPGTE